MFNKCIGFILLQILSSKFILGYPTEEPKTMYEAVTEQCPNIEETSLKKNEIFTKKCLNWAEINATSNLNETTKSNVECLVYYESFLSFCKDMGETLRKVDDGVIPLNSMLKHYTLDEVCHGNYTIYPASETVHNISSLIKNKVVCEIFCGTLTGTVSDICAFAYYFTNFNVSKFSNKLKTFPNKNPENSEHLNAHEAVEVKPVSVNKTNDDLLKNNESKTASLASNSLNKTDLQPVIPDNFDNSKALLPKPEQSENNPNPNEIPPREESKHDEQSVPMKVDQKMKPAEESVHTNNEPSLDKKGDAEENNVKKDSDQQPKASADIKDGNEIKADPEKAEIEPEKEEADPEKGEADPEKGEADPEKSRKSENNIETPQEQGENPGDLNEDKNENVNDSYQEGFGMNEAEADQDDGNVKPEPVMPQDSEPKKVKPSTVEDEAVSSFNTQEDDMDGDSYFFSYFTVIMCLFIVGYVGYHNRQKVLALILEGKKGQRSGRSRRPNSANYHKLDTNLEEAISSSCKKNTSNVIY